MKISKWKKRSVKTGFFLTDRNPKTASVRMTGASCNLTDATITIELYRGGFEFSDEEQLSIEMTLDEAEQFLASVGAHVAWAREQISR